ncbi:MAG: heavy metal translocating P-type ATPase [Planctomycetota bacterium]
MTVTSTSIRCSHCELPVPSGLLVEGAEQQFCCGGCRVAFQLIHDAGLDTFYDMAEDSPSLASLDPTPGDYLEFDQPEFQQKFVKTINGEVSETTLALDGIHCAACIWLIEKLPQIARGVNQAELNWAKQTVTLRWQTGQIRLSAIAQTLMQLGYTPHPIRASEHEDRRNRENRIQLARIGFAAAVAGNNMLIAIALYLGMFSQMGSAVETMLRVASCIIGMVALLGPGRIFLKGALSAIRTRTPHMDLPIALGLTVGTFAGLINTIRGSGEIYFDSLSVLIFFLLVGRWIQFRQQNRAVDSIEMLYRMTPKRTRKWINNVAVETFVDQVNVGDHLEILPGDLIPVDGVVVHGESRIDESIMTGESMPVPKTTGDPLLAGTQNQQSVITMVATSTHDDTRLSSIMGLVEKASSNKPKIVQWADQVGGRFVTIILIVAFITLVTWITLDAAVAIDRTVALLIVACPCALALATPLAIAVALGRAASKRIMIKSGDVLQSLDRPGIIWLDKTGTLTQGRLAVVQWDGDPQWQSVVANLETKSNHPVAKAIVQEFGTSDFAEPVTSIVESEGQGIVGTYQNQQVFVGNTSWMQEHQIPITESFQQISNEQLQLGYSPCWVAVDGRLVAVISMGDRLRHDSRSAIEAIRNECWQVGILSGDHPSIVHQIADQLDIATEMALGGLSPEEKVDHVHESHQTYPTVVMVGDGVNDSVALAAATVGIAVHGGAEASLSAAPVYFADEGLRPIMNLLGISRSARRTMTLNLAISLIYNFAGATLAFLGFIDPLVAAILMPISSLTVVALSLTSGKAATNADSIEDSREAEAMGQTAPEWLPLNRRSEPQVKAKVGVS